MYIPQLLLFHFESSHDVYLILAHSYLHQFNITYHACETPNHLWFLYPTDTVVNLAGEILLRLRN